MTLTVIGKTVEPITIGNLKSRITPLVYTVGANDTDLAGTNLVFPDLRVGADGTTHKMSCVNSGKDCKVPNLGSNEKGFFYFVVAPNLLVPAVQVTDTGVKNIFHQPPAKTKSSPKSPSTAPQGTGKVKAAPPLYAVQPAQ